MNQLVVLAGCAVFLVALTGCQKADNTERVIIESVQNADNTVKVIVEGGGQFPQFLVGTWKENKLDWEFVFEPDGTISSAVIDGGKIRVNPVRKTATTSLKGWGDAVYKLGQWTVQYSPANRELAVQVVVEHYYIKMDEEGRGMKGDSTDWFVGPVSDSGRSWEADWYTLRKTIFLAPEPTEFPFDPNENPIETLVFRKQPKTN